jgi:hypothetical protein
MIDPAQGFKKFCEDMDSALERDNLMWVRGEMFHHALDMVQDISAAGGVDNASPKLREQLGAWI